MGKQPHQPARQVGPGAAEQRPDKGRKVDGYPDLPPTEPGLTGGPATEAVPGSHGDDSPLGPPIDPTQRHKHAIANPPPGEAGDGGESVISSTPRETGGVRPPKEIPKTDPG
jgi:hypothetical protein